MWLIILRKAIWLIKQLFPCMYCTQHSEGGVEYVTVYRMWMGKTYAAKQWEVTKERRVTRG